MTDPRHAHRPAHTMDARHPRALFPALAAPDSRPTIGVLALQGDVREHSLPSRRPERDPSSCAAPPIWARLPATGSTAW